MNSYIIEGCDATGKTWLCNYIKTKKDLGYIHLDEKINDYNNFFQLSNIDNVVYDRFVLSEYVYSKVFGRKRKVSLEDIRIILNKWRSENRNKIIILNTDPDVIYDRLCARGEFIEPRLIKEICGTYEILADLFDIPFIDNTSFDYDPEELL